MLPEHRPLHVVASTNCPPSGGEPDRERSLLPLNTLLDYIRSESRRLERVLLVESNSPQDGMYYTFVMQVVPAGVKVSLAGEGDEPARVAGEVSRAAVAAQHDQADLWIDLTPGPKHRSAVLFTAGSAVPDVQIMYSEQVDGRFRVRQLPSLGSFNTWLGTHGIQVRDYRRELVFLQRFWNRMGGNVPEATISRAVSTVLSSLDPTITSEILTLAEWSANVGVPVHLLNRTETEWRRGPDDVIKDHAKNERNYALDKARLIPCFRARQ